MILLAASVTAATYAQLTDEQAEGRARTFISVLSPEDKNKPATVTRETMRASGQSVEHFLIHVDEIMVGLTREGYFIGFSNSSGSALRPKGGSPDKFKTDEEAWDALDELIDKLDLNLPPELNPSELKRLSSEGQDYTYLFYKRPSPFGYANSSGNYLSAQLHRITGRVLGLSVARGWTYERPDLRVSEAQAVEKGIEHFGGTPAEWRGRQLQYASMDYDRAPEYLKPIIAQKVMRLMHIVTSAYGTVMVDSVTGAVVDTWQMDSSKEPGKRVEVNATTKPDLAKKKPEEQQSSLPFALGGLAVIALAGIVVTRVRSAGAKK